MPNHRMTSGIRARCGTLRTICSELSRSRAGYDPVEQSEDETDGAADREPRDRTHEADLDMVKELARAAELPRRQGDARGRWQNARRHEPGRSRDLPAGDQRHRQEPG